MRESPGEDDLPLVDIHNAICKEAATMWPLAVESNLLLPGTKVCRYSWHSAGSLGWPFPTLKCKYIFQIFQIKYTEAILSSSTHKLLLFEISKMPIVILKIGFILFLL